MGRVTIEKDEAEKRSTEAGHDALRMTGLAPGMVGRWVRTGGHDPEGHMQRMREKGYVPVERTKATEGSGGHDPRLQSGQHAQVDGCVRRGDLMLMQRSVEVDQRRRAAAAEFAKSRSKSALDRLKQLGGYQEKE